MTTDRPDIPNLRRVRRRLGLAITASGLVLLAAGAVPALAQAALLS